MKRKVKITLTLLSMVILFSCGYETYVINTVHEDGSVTRKVIIKNSEEKFEPENYRVPVDSTWQTRIDTDVNEKGDTSWILTAEKHFGNVDEINEEYKNDKGSNQDMERKSHFSKSFKWFTTVFRYSETIDKTLTISCPISDFLTDEELKFFYLPDNVETELKNGSDSLKYEALSDTIETKSELWIWTSFIRQWIEIFYDLFEDNPDLTIDREEMRLKESQAIRQVIKDDDVGDQFFISVLGEEFFYTFETEIDSSISVLDEMIEPFLCNSYDMEIRMPGRLIASNGYADTDPDFENNGGILWTVKGEYFLTQQYEMWAESRVNNYWAWIISALFILFVITGFVIRSKKEKD